MIINKLIEKIKQCNNHTVVGLDPRLEYVPSYIKDYELNDNENYSIGVSKAFYRYNKQIIDNICDIVPAVKPQIAFYEQYGAAGIECYIETIKYARLKGMIVIGDIKRGDIGSTAEGYADFHLGNNPYSANTDLVTLNPYLGTDSLLPFIRACDENEKGIFVLVKTSNASSVDIQDLISGSKRVYEHVAELVVQLGNNYKGSYGYSFVGAVVGATYREEAARLRSIMKHNYFLVPGYGAQGGTAADVAACFNEDGLGAVVNSSRGIIAAHLSERYKDRYKEEGFAQAAREAAIEMKEDINQELKKQGKIAW